MRHKPEISIIVLLLIASIILFNQPQLNSLINRGGEAYKSLQISPTPEPEPLHVVLQGILDEEISNVSLYLSTLKKNYLLGEEVNLTDPPVNQEVDTIVETFKSSFQKEETIPPGSNLVIGSYKDDKLGIYPSEDKARAELGYIIEFQEEPVLKRKARLVKKIKEKEKLLKKINEQPQIIMPTGYSVRNLELELEDDKKTLPSKVAQYNNELIQKQNRFKEKIRRKIKELGYQYRFTFNGMHIKADFEAINEISKMPEVKEIYENKRVYAFLYDSVPQIEADKLWSMYDSLGRNITGHNITIAVIDSGVDYTHFDLGHCNPTNDINDGSCEKVIGGYDYIYNDNNPMDDHGHGTHCAATAAGNGTLYGVAPNAKIIAYKVMDLNGSGSGAAIIAAIERSADLNHNGIPAEHDDDLVEVISMSLGAFGGYPDDPLAQSVDNVVEIGVVAVIAAGNSGPYNNTIGTPGCARKAITVGAVDKNDVIADFSSRGPVAWGFNQIMKPDLVAPGVRICAAQWDDFVSQYQCHDNEHIAISGTSMATPHVAGAVALIRQAFPDWVPERVKFMLRQTADDLGYEENVQGAGRINLTRLVNQSNNITNLILPYSLNFGVINSRNDSNTTLNFSITSFSGTKDFNISILSDNAPGVTFNFTNQTSIEENETKIINITLQYNKEFGERNSYQDTLIIESENETYQIRIYFRIDNMFVLRFVNRSPAENGLVVLNHTTKESVAHFLIMGDQEDVYLYLPLDVYDFMVFFIDPITSERRENGVILREGIDITQTGTITINRSEAINYLNTSVYNKNGDLIDENITEIIFFPLKENLLFGLTIDSTDALYSYDYKYNMRFSNISEYYPFSYFGMAYNNKDFYVTKAYYPNFSMNVSEEFFPEEYYKKILHYNINKLPNHNISNLILNAIALAQSGRSGGEYGLFRIEYTNFSVEEPYYQDAYIIPDPSSEYDFLGFKIEVLENSSFNEWGYLYELYKTNYIGDVNEIGTTMTNKILTYITDDPAPPVSFYSEDMPLEFGLFPHFIQAFFDNTQDSIDSKIFWSKQMPYDRNDEAFLMGSIYADDTLICNRNFNYNSISRYYLNQTSRSIADACPELWNVEFPARIKFVLHKPLVCTENWKLHNHEINFSFDMALQDSNPPTLLNMTLLADNAPSFNIDLNKQNTLQFVFNEENLATASLWFINSNGEWLDLEFTPVDDTYSTDLPIYNYEAYSFYMYAEDASGNYMQYYFELPTSIQSLEKSQIINPDPYNISAFLNMSIEQYDSEWRFYEQNYYENTAIQNNSNLALDLIWNNNPFVPSEVGPYKAVVQLEDESGNIIIGTRGEISDEYIFFVYDSYPYTPCVDSDNDGHYNYSLLCPDGDDCNDNNPNVYPDALELCDNLDNDCDPGTDDGIDEPWLNMPCDGADSDLCQEGNYYCIAGSQICDDNTGDILDLCNGLDDDCNAVTDDGIDESWYGDSCDGLDSDLCLEGTFYCDSGNQACSDTMEDSLELCNGLDDDCNAATADGSDESWFNAPCDGLDSDLCEEGLYECNAGIQECTDDTAGEVEICDNIDNDCDGSTDEDLTQVCGSDNCAGTQTCDAGTWSECSTNANDCGVCCICDAAGTETFDETQDVDCGGTSCPEDGCGLSGCGENILADYPDMSTECEALFTCSAESCDGVCEPDADLDNYSASCGDCDDSHPFAYPNASDLCGNGVDENCDGSDWECPLGDVDGDNDIDLDDLVLVSMAIGCEQDCGAEDLNADTKVNILDMIYVGKNYGADFSS